MRQGKRSCQTVKNFNDQFQQRLLDNWEADKARILQDELGVTDDEITRLSSTGLGSSTLTRSTLGGSVRKVGSYCESLR
jgi:nuclear pore complex protein Nup93